MTQRKLQAPVKSIEAAPTPIREEAPALAALTPEEFRDFADDDIAVVIRLDTETNRLFFRAYNMAEADAGTNMLHLGTAVVEGTIGNLMQRLNGVVASLTEQG